MSRARRFGALHRLPRILALPLPAAMLSVALAAGCTDASLPAGSDSRPAGEVVEVATRAARGAPSTATLQPGQRLQGTITLDLGEGSRTYRVLATKIADDLGQRAAERLAGKEGKAALEEANARVGGPAKVGASEVQALADAFAGRTMYSAQVRAIEIVRREQVSIEGEATDGSKVTLGFSLAIGGDEVLDPTLEYRPAGKRVADRFESKSRKGGKLRLALDRLERGSADSWSIAGSFDAADMQPGVLAKGLAGQTLPRASGRFDITELHVRAP